MLRFCLFYGFLLLVTALTEEDTPNKRYNSPVRENPGKNELLPMSDDKTKVIGESSDQFGSLQLIIHSSKGVLNDGTPSLDLNCSAKSTETSLHQFFWMRKGPGENRFIKVVGITPTGGLTWPPNEVSKGWRKHQLIQDKQLVDGDLSKGSTVSFTLHIPLVPCEDEGHFRCLHYFQKEKNTRMHTENVVFHFNTALICGNLKGKSARPKSSKHRPSALATLLEDENVNYADLALKELAAIILLVIILIVAIICCVRHRRNANKTKKIKEKKSDADLTAKRKSSRSETRTSRSGRNLNSKSHLSSHRQPSYYSTDPAYYSPRPNRSRTSPYQSMTRMNGPPPLPPSIGGVPPSMGGPPPPPSFGGAPQFIGGQPPPPPIGGPPQSVGGPTNPPPPHQMGRPTETPATVRPDRNALLASINARRVSSSNL